MTVHAGSIILEPGLTGNNLGEVAKQGVWLAKAGFGAFAALTNMPRIAAATGSNASVYRLDCGSLSAGKAADIVLIHAPDGGTQRDALSANRKGDIAAVGAVITAGAPRFVGRSRNTPATTRNIRVAACHLPRDFSGGRQDRRTLRGPTTSPVPQNFARSMRTGCPLCTATSF
jgi:hypothetical protein